MLTPEQVTDYTNRCTALFDELNDNILRDMIRRIEKTARITDTAKWQLERARALGESTQTVLREMRRLDDIMGTKAAVVFFQAMMASDEQDAQIFAQAGQPYTRLGESRAAQQLAMSGWRRTRNTLWNLTQTRALMGNRNLPESQQLQLGRELDAAHMKVSSGAFSYTEAIRSSIKNLSQQGVAAITYPSGHVDSLDVVARRAILTGINQTSGDIALHNGMTAGLKYMELTAHIGARVGNGHKNKTNHAWWQGHLVCINGDPEPEAGPDCLTLDDIGYGDVQGFMGANCRHNWHPFFLGISQRLYDQEALDRMAAATVPYHGAEIPRWKADEMQRAYERKIRACKREFILARDVGDTDAQRAAAAKLKRTRAALRDFLRETGLLPQSEREQVLGFGRSEAASASAMARRQTT